MLTQSGEEPVECPLCMEPLEVDDLTFFPCTCGYQICRFCWHRIRTDENGLCPACRKPYAEDPADFRPLSREEVAHLKAQKKQKNQQRKQKIMENRKHLANVRVVQRNLVFVVGLPSRLADGEVLKKHEYFGKYGKIQKVVINRSTSYAGSQGPSASAYVTYQKPDDALRAIQAVNNIIVDGRPMRSSLGTTKYCSHFLKNQMCPKPDCMYLHELGDAEASFTKEDMQQGKHQDYEKRLHEQLLRERKQASAVVVPSNNSNCQTMNGSAMNCPTGVDGSTKQHSAAKIQGVPSDDRQYGFPLTDSTKSSIMQERRYRSASSSQSHSIAKINKGVCDFDPKEIVNSIENSNSSHREDSLLASPHIIEMTDTFNVATSADGDLGVSVTVTDIANPNVKIVEHLHSPMYCDPALNQLSGSKSGSELFINNQISRTNKRFRDDAQQRDRQDNHADNGGGETLNVKSKLSDTNCHSQIPAVKRGVPNMNRFQNGKDKGKHSSGFLYHQHKNIDADAKYTKSIMNDAKMSDNGRTRNDMGFDPFRKSQAALAEMVKKETVIHHSFCNQHNAFSQLPSHMNAVEDCRPVNLVSNRQQRQNHRLPTNVTGCTKLLDGLGINRGMSAGSSVSRRTRYPPPGFATTSNYIQTFGISQSRSDADL